MTYNDKVSYGSSPPCRGETPFQRSATSRGSKGDLLVGIDSPEDAGQPTNIEDYFYHLAGLAPYVGGQRSETSLVSWVIKLRFNHPTKEKRRAEVAGQPTYIVNVLIY